MKKFVITEEEKKQIRSIYEDRFLMEGDSSNFLLRRWDTFKDIYDYEIKSAGASVCHFKQNDDFDGYLKYISKTIARSMFIKSFNLSKATQEYFDKYVDFTSEVIRDNFSEEIEKKYQLKEC